MKEVIRSIHGVRQLSLLRQRIGFRSSALYWEQNYARGGTSGRGSYYAAADAKAAFLKAFAHTREVKSVIDFGCSDGHRLPLAQYASYIGLDVSRCAVGLCQRLFASDPTKSFFLYDGASFADRGGHFPLIEDAVFDTYMTHLYATGRTLVIIYATNQEIPGTAPHVRY